MTELTGFNLERLWGDGEFVLFRGKRDTDLAQVLVVTPALENPTPETIARLEHAYSLAGRLDPAWAAQPLKLVHHEGRTALLLEDPGGDPLERVLGSPMQPAQFLPIAIGIAVALKGLHARSIVHRNVTPGNILVDLQSGHVWLTGFGIASPLPRERQLRKPPAEIAGTLAYMAPEQTGHMNRSIDSRSDLYSYGVILYEMLTGVLPFTAADPLEWIHCHMARQPMLPGERVKGVSDSLAAIVMKLLAKTPEERYQTAAGVEADLRICLAAPDEAGLVTRFPLGTHDTPDRLVIPEKLYGREREIYRLLAAFERVSASDFPEFVLMSGYSGVGKSAVLDELLKHLLPQHGFFASCKFDRNSENMPYAMLAGAFRTLIDQILVDSDAEVSHWRDALQEAVGPNGQLIVNLIPELEFVIGRQPPVPDLAPMDAQNRFQLVFRRFVNVFPRPEHPLALFLDDLQWADAATLELVERLATEQEIRHVFLVGAYTSSEVSPSNPLMRTFDTIREAGAHITDITLLPLSLDDIGRMVADSLVCEQAFARPLAELVHEKTGGNPFFAIQFLTALAEEGLLTFDSDAMGWSWDLAPIRAKDYTNNVADLMGGKLSRLSQTTQEALGQLACLGNTIEVRTLALVWAASEAQIHAALSEAVAAGLIFRRDSFYAFVHGRIQEAAYALIPEHEREAVHLRIGRLFLSRMTPEEIEKNVFEIVNQLDRGIRLIDSLAERARVAEMHLAAGLRAKASTAYNSALTYFVSGRTLLSDESWDRRYSLTFALELQRAECEFLTGDLAAAEKQLETLSRRAKTLEEGAAVARLQTELYSALDQNDRAVGAALECLRRAGIDWSPHPTDDEVRQEYEYVWQQLGDRTIEALVDLPTMNDAACRAIVDVLTAMEEPAYFVDQNLRCLIIARIVNLSLERGNSDGSCLAYVQLGWLVGPRFGDYKAAYRFGILGLELVEKRGLERFRTRVCQCFGYFINPWSRHLRTSLELLRRSFITAQETGDLKYAVYSCDRLVTLLLAAGEPLLEVQRDAQSGLEFARKAKFGYIVDILMGQLRFIQALLGLTANLASFNDADFDESRFERNLETNPHSAFAGCWYWIRKLQACFYAGDYALALEAASKAEPLLQSGPGHFESAEFIFFGALARAAHYDSASSEQRLRYRDALVASHKQTAVWAENCPENFGNREALLAAEIARIEGRELDAESFYEKAIQSAREHGFVQIEAIANEVAARFYSARGVETIAHTYLRNARHCYLRWGAHGKVRQLDQSHPPLYEERTYSSSITTIGAPVAQVDVGTVVKLSQAISSEIVLDKLIEALMRIAVEHAGAERAVLVVALRADELQIEAEAQTDHGRITVVVRRARITPSDLPKSVLHYVVRTRESVVLHDASIANVFLRDEYLRRRRTRSVLCLPIVTQAKLVGVLYLENDLTSGAFTPDRLVALELLASQAAISLEHAQLYADLQQENIERKRAEEERLRHLWFLETMDQVNRAIQGTNNLEQMMSDVLDAVLSIFRCDRAWLVYPCDPDAHWWTVPMEHTRPEFPGVFALGLHLPVDSAISQVFQIVRAASGPVTFGPGSAHPIPIEATQRFGIQSQMAVVIRPKVEKSYLLGLHQCSHPRVWTPLEERLFQEIGRRFEDALTSLLIFRNLRESERKLEEAQRLTHVGYWERDPKTDLITWSDETYRIFGLQRQERSLTLANLADLVHPEDLQIVLQAVAEALRGGGRYDVEYRVLRPDGTVRLVHSQGDVIWDESGRPCRMFGTVQDITERKRSEQRLIAQHAVAKMLAEAATFENVAPKVLQAMCEFLLWDLGLLWRFDREAGVLRCTEVWHRRSAGLASFERVCRATVCSPDIGLPGRVWSSRQPEYRSGVPNDSDFPRASLSMYKELHATFGFPILFGEDVFGVMEFFNREMRPLEQDLLDMAALLGSQIGQFIERKHAEEALHNAQMELAHLTRVATLGEMTASIAHEINQPLTSVVANGSAGLRWLAAQSPNLEEARSSLQRIVRDGKRAGDVIARIRALVQKSRLTKARINLNETIEEVLAIIGPEARQHRIAIRTEFCDDLPPVQGDRVQLQQVILNLVINGIEAMKTITDRVRELLIRSHLQGGKLVVAVQDSGTGLDQHRAEQLFEAFYTSKPEGMGLGLSISRSIIAAHGGELSAASNTGPGATFQFTLPLEAADT